MTGTDLAALHHEWDRFASWLAEHSPADRATLRGPAGGAQLTALEAHLGFPLHPEFRALLEMHDGTDTPSGTDLSAAQRQAGAFLPLGHRMVGAADIPGLYDILAEVGADHVDAAGDDFEDDDEDLATHLHQCVPFAIPNDGGFAFVDHRPGPSYGHVYEMGIGSGDLDGELWATGLTELFRSLADALEQGTPFTDFRPSLFEDESGHLCLEWDLG